MNFKIALQSLSAVFYVASTMGQTNCPPSQDSATQILDVVTSQRRFENLDNLQFENRLLDWKQIEMNLRDFDKLRGKDINQKIAIIRSAPPEGYGIPVLIFNVKPEVDRAKTPELKLDNPPEFTEWLRFYENPAQPEYVWGINNAVYGQYLPPYIFNNNDPKRQRNRPGIDRGQIHLSPMANDATVVHELSHSFFQTQIFPNPVRMSDGRLLHPYLAASEKMNQKYDQLQISLKRFNELIAKQSPHQETLYAAYIDLLKNFIDWANLKFISVIVSKMEEAILFRMNMDIGASLGLSEESKKTYYWKSIASLMEVHSAIDEITKNQQIYQDLLKALQTGNIDPALRPGFEKLQNRVSKSLGNIRRQYAEGVALAVKMNYTGVLSEMEKAGRVKLVIRAGEVASVIIVD